MKALTFLVIIVLVGCSTPTKKPPEARFRTVQLASGDMIKVSGLAIHATESHVRAITEAVAQIKEAYPILEIVFIEANTAEVTTGLIRGPLDAVGRTYIFRLRDGKWRYDKTNIGIWVS